MIGFQGREIDGELRREPVIHTDLDDPRVNEPEGEAVFLEHGGQQRVMSGAITDRTVRMICGIVPEDVPWQSLMDDSEPVVLRGLASHWPLVKAGLQSASSAIAYLKAAQGELGPIDDPRPRRLRAELLAKLNR